MNLGIIGLGRMGANMARRLRLGNIPLAAFNRSSAVTTKLAAECGVTAMDSIEQLVQSLEAPRVVWLMLPAGETTQEHIDLITPILSEGDVIVDGANSCYKDSMARAAALQGTGIDYIDAGVSGGVWGLANGYAMMVGGTDEAFAKIEAYIKVLAPGEDKGWMHCGPVGSGHYTKMIHNGIEYGMMQAFAEGFALLKNRDDFDMDLAKIAEMWRHGSVVRSWMLDLSAEFLNEDQNLDEIAPFVADSGEGRWTAIEAIEQGIPSPVMTTALMARFESQGKATYSNKMLSMMRKGFGGHAVKSKD